MANTIRIKRRIGGATGAPSTLGSSELAFNENSGGRILYYGLGDNSFGVATSVIAIGGPDFAVTATTNANLTGPITSVGNATSVAAQTGTGTTFVMNTSPTLVTPLLGTPSSGTLTSCTGLPISTGVSGLGTGVAAFLATPSSANLAAALTDETGTGANVFATSPTLVTPLLGTPTSGTLTSCTGLPISTGVSGLGTGVAAFLATPSSANLAAALTDETGSGAVVLANTPTLITPNIGAATGTSLVLSGSLTVNGSVTTISSTTLSVADKNIELAQGSVTEAAADGGGLTLHGLTDHTWNWVLSTTSWTSSDHINVASGKSYYINGTVVLSATSLGSGIILDGGTF